MYAIEPDPADAWMARGLCTTEDPRLWDGRTLSRSEFAPRDFSQAKAICDVCPVEGKCLSRAVETGDIGCMRGGKTPAELEKLVTAKSRSPRRRAKVVKPKRAKVAA